MKLDQNLINQWTLSTRTFCFNLKKNVVKTMFSQQFTGRKRLLIFVHIPYDSYTPKVFWSSKANEIICFALKAMLDLIRAKLKQVDWISRISRLPAFQPCQNSQIFLVTFWLIRVLIERGASAPFLMVVFLMVVFLMVQK